LLTISKYPDVRAKLGAQPHRHEAAAARNCLALDEVVTINIRA